MSNFFDYEGITFNRELVQVVSGRSFDPEQPGRVPYFRVVLRDGVEWQVEAANETELAVKRVAFLRALRGPTL